MNVNFNYKTDFNKTQYIFDFDCTITHRNLSNFFHFFEEFIKINVDQTDNNIINKLVYFRNKMINIIKTNSKVNNEDKEYLLDLIFGGKQRLDSIIYFFKSLINNNAQLVIASRGRRNEIVWILELFDLKKYFTNIFCLEIRKTKILNTLIKMNVPNIIYIDDNHEEHKELILLFDNPKYILNIKNLLEYKLSNTNYFFYDGLELDNIGGMNNTIIKLLNDINKYINNKDIYLKINISKI